MTPLRVAQAMTGTGGSGLVVPTQRGGTGKTSWVANRIPYLSSATAFGQVAFPSVAGSLLAQGTSGAPYFRSDIITALDLVSGLTNVDGQQVDVTFTLTAGKYNGVVASGTNTSAGFRLTGDYAEYTLNMSQLPANSYLFIPAQDVQFIGGGSASGGGGTGQTSRQDLYVNGAYHTVLSVASFSRTLRPINWSAIAGILIPKTMVVRYRLYCTQQSTRPQDNYWEVPLGTTQIIPMKCYAKASMK